MKILVTGSSGHAGNEIAKLLEHEGHTVIGIDKIKSRQTTVVGDITDWDLLNKIVRGMDVIIHTASLHAPHIALFPREVFVNVNIQGTLKLLELSKKHSVQKFIYTSTTSVYGKAMQNDHQAVWVTEDTIPIPRDIYDITKLTAESLCEEFYQHEQLPCMCLRVSRFWNEPMENRLFYRMYRGLDVRDVAEAHKLALKDIGTGFEVFNISAQSPFSKNELRELKQHPSGLIETKVPGLTALYEEKGWEMPQEIDRVYVIDKAKRMLGFKPKVNVNEMLDELRK